MWFRQIDAFAKTFTVVALDRRGAGKSTTVADISLELDDIDAVLAEADANTAYIVGMSQGGRVGLRYASTRPGKIRGLVLQSAPLDGLSQPAADTDAIPIELYRSLSRSGQLEELRHHWSKHRLMTLPKNDVQLQQQIRAILQDCRWPEILATRALVPFSNCIAAGLHRIPFPVFVVTGEHDPNWLKAVAHRIASDAPRAAHAVIPDAAHLSNATHAAVYNHLVASFFGKFRSRAC